jgi:hypothetical protein
MKISRQVEIRSFTIPSYVVVENDSETAIPLSELEYEALDSLCAEFTRAVFVKAGKHPPMRTDVQPSPVAGEKS